MALFTGAIFVVQVSLIIVAKPFYAIFLYLLCTSQAKNRVYCLPDGGQPGTPWNAVVRNETDLAN